MKTNKYIFLHSISKIQSAINEQNNVNNGILISSRQHLGLELKVVTVVLSFGSLFPSMHHDETFDHVSALETVFRLVPNLKGSHYKIKSDLNFTSKPRHPRSCPEGVPGFINGLFVPAVPYLPTFFLSLRGLKVQLFLCETLLPLTDIQSCCK